MTDSNRLRLTVARQPDLHVPPVSPRMRTMRITGESLKYEPQFVQPDEIRDDRMNADPVKINENNNGGINYQLSFPVDESPLSEFYRSMMFNPWMNTPYRDNDGTADSVITGVAATGGIITIVTGAAFVTGQLIRATGFGAAGNNGLFKVTTGSATVPAVGDGLLTDEAAPGANARIKVVGFEGAAGDITALADGLGSTALDFTTLGLAVGQFVKIGGVGAGFRFATDKNNSFARIVAVAAKKITLDNLPTGWAAGAGAGKTIRVFTADWIKNGTTTSALMIERGFMGQAVPTYIRQYAMVVGEATIDITSEQLISGTFTVQGLKGEKSTVSIDPTPDKRTTNANVSANVNVGRIAENGAPITGGNFVKALQITVNNNLRILTADGEVGGVDIGVGEVGITVNLETYFKTGDLLDRLFDNLPTNVNAIVTKNSQAVIYSLPRLTYTGGAPSAGAKNQDVMLPLSGMASIDPLTESHIMMSRFEYYEA